MTFVWLLPAALHSGAPVGLSLVDRGVVFQMQLHGAHVLDQPLRRREAFLRARGLGLLLWGGEELATVSTTAVRLRRSCMAFVCLLPAALHSGVLPSVLVLSTVALCFRCLRSCSMAPIVALISRCGASDSYPPKKPGGGRASGRIKSRGRREPGEWVGELTSCLTAVYDEAR